MVPKKSGPWHWSPRMFSFQGASKGDLTDVIVQPVWSSWVPLQCFPSFCCVMTIMSTYVFIGSFQANNVSTENLSSFPILKNPRFENHPTQWRIPGGSWSNLYNYCFCFCLSLGCFCCEWGWSFWNSVNFQPLGCQRLESELTEGKGRFLKFQITNEINHVKEVL